MKTAMRTLLVSALLVGILPAQGTLEIAIDTFPGPAPTGNHSFYTGGEVVAPNGTLAPPITNVVLTEQLQIRVTTTPSPQPLPPGTFVPRKLAIFVSPVDPAGMAGVGLSVPLGPLFVNLDPAAQALVLPFQEVVNSFRPANSLDPVFGALPGPNTVIVNVNLDYGAFPVLGQEIVFQAIAEDSYVPLPPSQGPPTPPLLLSGGARVRIDAPSTAGFAPTLTALSMDTTSEAMPGMVTLTGTNFLAQSNWIRFQPTVLFGTTPVKRYGVSILSDTQMTVQVPDIQPTDPPRVFGCELNVSVQNHPQIDPMGTVDTLPLAFTYITSNDPQFRMVNPIVCTTTPPGIGIDPEFPTANGCTIFGTWLLDGLVATFSQAGAPTDETRTFPVLPLVNQAQPPATRELETSPFTAPIFCSGVVAVSLENCDARTSPTTATLTYRTITPTVSAPASANAGQTLYTLPAALTGPPALSGIDDLIVFQEGAPSVTLKAVANTFTPSGTTGFITATSPLATAPTVPPASFDETRTELAFGAPNGIVAQPGIVAQDRETLTGAPTIPAQTGDFRPALGVKTMTTVNALCVGGLSASRDVLVQDEQAPAISSITRNGAQEVQIAGSNFFCVRPGGSSRTQVFDPIAIFGSGCAPTNGVLATGAPTPFPLAGAEVPLVLFRNLTVGLDFMAPRVTLDSTGQLSVCLRPFPGLPCITTDVFVINPDGQVSNADQFTLITPLTRTDVSAIPSINGVPQNLDTAGLIEILNHTDDWVTGQTADAPAILAVLNPCPARDRNRDPMSGINYTGSNPGGELPIGPNVSYELAFLFNTRDPATDEPRIFRFETIDLPQTLDLAGEPGAPWQLPRFFPFFNAATSVATLDPGQGTLSASQYRVLIKGLGARITGPFASAPAIEFDPALDQPFNWPLYLESVSNVSIDGFINLAGDCFLPEDGIANDRFFAQVKSTLPPAGGGQGGFGGVQGLPSSIPAINPGVTSLDLRGEPGTAPSHSSLTMGMNGGGAVGSAPIAFTVGSGGSGGHATDGSGGGAGGGIGLTVGNFTTGCATGNAPCGIPGDCASMSGDDRIVFGWTTEDFVAFNAGTVFGPTATCNPGTQLPDRDLFYGGAGGGGGGGIFSLIGFVAALGGRGGNGGGCLLLITDGVLDFQDAGAISVAGELGLPGIQQFPSPGALATSLASPGAGGSGSGGTVFVLTTQTVNFHYSSGAIAANEGLTRAFIDGRGARGVSLSPIPTVGQAAPPLGIGGSGRIRVAVSAASPGADAFAATLEGLFMDTITSPVPNTSTPLILPVPDDPSTTMVDFPSGAPLPPSSMNGDYYRYPCF